MKSVSRAATKRISAPRRLRDSGELQCPLRPIADIRERTPRLPPSARSRKSECAIRSVLMAARRRVCARQSWSRQSHAFHSGYPWAQNRLPHAQQIRRVSHRRHRRPGSQTNCENQARSDACRSGIAPALFERRPFRPIANLLHPPSWYESRGRRGNTPRSCSCPERRVRTPKGPFSTARRGFLGRLTGASCRNSPVRSTKVAVGSQPEELELSIPSERT